MFSKVENTSFTLSQSPSPSGHASSARSSLTLIPESNVRAPLSATPTKGVEKLMYKSNLSSYCQRLCLPHPVYGIVSQGARHALRFSSTVTIGRKMFASPNTFSNRKSAEQDAAKFALQHLLNEDEAIVTNMRGSLCEFVCQDKALCKMVLNEFLAKIKMECAYETVQVEMTPWFVSYLALNGTCYRGGGRKKKVAEQLAALAAILSLLDNPTYAKPMYEVIKPKFDASELRDFPNTRVAGHQNGAVAISRCPYVYEPRTSPLLFSGPLHGIELAEAAQQASQGIIVPIEFVPPPAAHNPPNDSISAKKRRRIAS